MSLRSLFIAAGKILAVIVLVIWSAGPILFIVLSSLKPAKDIWAYPPSIIFVPIFSNYTALLSEWDGFFHSFGNSIIVSIGAVILSCLLSFPAGYACSRIRSRMVRRSMLFMLLIRLIPPIIITIPLFPAVDYLGLSDTRAVLIILYAAFWVSVFTMIIKNFVDSIPRELDEAAAVDGASIWVTLFRIALPLCMQGIATGCIFVLVYAWNEYLFAFIFTTQNAVTTPVIISQVMSSPYGTDWGVLFAGVTFQLLPVVVLIVLAQNLIVSGLLSGSVKG